MPDDVLVFLGPFFEYAADSDVRGESHEEDKVPRVEVHGREEGSLRNSGGYSLGPMRRRCCGSRASTAILRWPAAEHTLERVRKAEDALVADLARHDLNLVEAGCQFRSSAFHAHPNE